MIHRNMPITGQNFLISQREFENGSCVDSKVCGRLSGSWQYMLPFTIYSILDVLGANSYSWHKFERFPSLVMRDVLVTMIQ